MSFCPSRKSFNWTDLDGRSLGQSLDVVASEIKLGDIVEVGCGRDVDDHAGSIALVEEFDAASGTMFCFSSQHQDDIGVL